MHQLKVLWAIDPLADKSQQLKMAKVIQAFYSGNSNVQIEPVAILSPDLLRLPVEVFKKESGHYKLQIEEKVKIWMKTLKWKNILEPTFLVSDEFSLRSTVGVFLEYVEESGASLIVLSSHGRSGIARIVLGSFAESVLLKTTTPLLVSNPKMTLPSKIKTIFFATDRSENSKEAYGQVLEMAKSIKAKVVLYHKVEYFIPETYTALNHNHAYEKYLEEDVKLRKKDLSNWQASAKQSNVKVELIFDDKPGFVTEHLLKYVKKTKPDLLALSSQSGQAEAVLLGSIARQVIRQSSVPVWVIHKSS